jgi:hypothetical protein
MLYDYCYNFRIKDMKNPLLVYQFRIPVASGKEAHQIGGNILHNCTIHQDQVTGFIRKDKLEAFIKMLREITPRPFKLITADRYMRPMVKRMTRSMNY